MDLLEDLTPASSTVGSCVYLAQREGKKGEERSPAEERGLISGDLLVKRSPDTSPGLYTITMFVHALQRACWFCMNNATDGRVQRARVVACTKRIAGPPRNASVSKMWNEARKNGSDILLLFWNGY